MPITIGSNIASLRAQRQLDVTGKGLGTTFERLSSGMRINKASDDAAGLAIASQLNSSKRVFNQGIRNFNDGLSLLSVADSAIEQLSGIVTRIQELATQSANGVLGNKQRGALDQEAQALAKEYTRIIQTTKFNGLSVLSADMGSLRLQGGYGTDGSIASNLGGATGTGEFISKSRNDLTFTNGTNAVLGDINGDGILDMVTAGSFEVSPSNNQGVINVLIGNGDGTFMNVVSTDGIFSSLSGIGLADLNNDGKLDIALSGYSNTGNNGRIAILLNTGNGTFGQAKTFIVSPYGIGEIAIADINNDGNLDIIGNTSYGSQDAFTINYGTGNGSISETVEFEALSAGRIKVVDVNSDGILDIVTGGEAASSSDTTIGIHLGNGNGTFRNAFSIVNTVANIYDMQIADLNGDGNLDIASSYLDPDGNCVNINLGNGQGTFEGATSYRFSDFTLALEIGDVNGDGITDVVGSGLNFSYESELSVMLGKADGTFESPTVNATNNIIGFASAFGDLNGDGVLDLTMIGSASILSSDASFVSFLGGTTTGVSTLLDFSLKTQADALQALPVMKRKLSQLAEQRGTIGAFQSRLSVGINTLTATSENYAAAASRITDVDVAEESAKLVRLQILQKAASSVLAQANQQPALAVKLLSSQ